MTPTVNFSHLKDLEDKAVVQHNLTFSNSSGSMSSLTTGVVSTIQGSEPTASMSGQSSTDPVVPGHNPAASHPKEQSTSTATIETMMTLSPSETRESTYGTRPPTTGKPDCNLIYAKTNIARQPHQGQNPTVERNTHKKSDEELAIEGNTLVNKCRMIAAQQQNGNIISSSGALLLDTIARNGDSRALVENDILDFQNQNTLALNATLGRPQSGRILSAQRTQHRISFVPNPVDFPSGQVLSEPIVRPKKQNIPSNGAVNYSVARAAAPSCDKTSNKGQAKKTVAKNKSPSFRKFTFPFGFGRRGKANQSSNGAPKDNRNNGEVRQMASEVCLVDGRMVVRPNSLALNGICAVPNEHHVSNMNLQAAGLLEAPDERTGATENSLNLELMNGNPSGCAEGSSSEGDATNEIANAGSSCRDNATLGGCGNTAMQQPTMNKDGAGNSSSPYDNSAGTDSTNKSSSHSERSVSDNMAYEASCSPVKRVNTCLV